ncbi:hypothetical protein [Agrobacterium vitis]|uniref:hypothetical protein n=1 Tax=Agrobacterium vitis TaxID=373 RepID=UPI001F3ABCD9|nr:hypothetical protein [Agrobacterium vitis]
MEKLPFDDNANQIFSYDGIPVGYFGGGIVPVKPGTYRYMPFRSLGHYMMVRSLEDGGRPVCSYKRVKTTVHFEVLGRSANRELHLGTFTPSDDE